MTRAPLELWAGVECTVNRVGDRFLDQVERTGHATRDDDMERLAALGARTVRYPVLWERTASYDLAQMDFRWADTRLARLRDLGIKPIVGLVHHGSGPAGTSLIDPRFPHQLAAYAREVAERYPWVTDYTPINEPLTTARFSGLYGLWYPHGRTAQLFVRALVNQCWGVVCAMRAIRQVTRSARLVQTEDIGHVSSTPRLAYQADFENHRKWLSFDLLCGRVNRQHPLWKYLVGNGIAEAELVAFCDAPCLPDVVGLNYYVTSDRFLDERIDRYPPCSHGGNGRDEYADVEAVRVHAQGIAGHRAHLDSAWRRYGLPLALTEVHLGCTREEQLRWLDEAWRGAIEARAAGADVRGVAVWSVFGAVDWDSLLVNAAGHYEPGAYDARVTPPRATAIVQRARALSEGGAPHATSTADGWWRLPKRLAYEAVGLATTLSGVRSLTLPWLLIPNETAACVLAPHCERRGLAMHGAERDEAAHRATRAPSSPWAIVVSADDALDAPTLRYVDRGVKVLLLARRLDDAVAWERRYERRAPLVVVTPTPAEPRQVRALRWLADLTSAVVDAALDLLVDDARDVWRVDGSGLATFVGGLVGAPRERARLS